MQAQDYFKKGDKAYIIVNETLMQYDSIVTECKIEKIVTEDRIKNYSKKDVTRKRRNSIDPKILADIVPEGQDVNEWKKQHLPNSEHFPKMAWVSFYNPFRAKEDGKWINVDCIKRNPNEFKEFIN